MTINSLYKEARQKYAEIGVDTDKAIEKLRSIPISIHCWQGDDVGGFEKVDAKHSGGGILATGNAKGKPRNIQELIQDIDKAFSLIPGKKKLNLHAIYGDFKGRLVDRDEIEEDHYKIWLDWAKANYYGLDFNPTLFSHRLCKDGFTLSSKDEEVRKFWVEHVKRTRKIANYFGKNLGVPCVNNIWIPDGSKDKTPSRLTHRKILLDSLEEIFSESYSKDNLIDAVEGKLFGIGYEEYTVGSHEFYLLYAFKKKIAVTFDTGHFHPTELVSDKVSSVLLFLDNIALHISRGVRWDSDHVPLLCEELISIMQEIKRADAFDRVFLGMDFFDSSINRVGAWVIGARAVAKALLYALLEPTEKIVQYEKEGNLFAKLALMEDLKTMPFSSVWAYYLESEDVPSDIRWISEVLRYEREVLNNR